MASSDVVILQDFGVRQFLSPEHLGNLHMKVEHEDGTFTVRLTVDDGRGGSAFVERSVTVSPESRTMMSPGFNAESCAQPMPHFSRSWPGTSTLGRLMPSYQCRVQGGMSPRAGMSQRTMLSWANFSALPFLVLRHSTVNFFTSPIFSAMSLSSMELIVGAVLSSVKAIDLVDLLEEGTWRGSSCSARTRTTRSWGWAARSRGSPGRGMMCCWWM